jgi:hypothetical protein
MTNKETTN